MLGQQKPGQVSDIGLRQTIEGEVFLLILPNTANDQTMSILDRLRSIISEMDGSAISVDMNLTMSAGVCSVGPTDSADDIPARADMAALPDERASRNCVVAVQLRQSAAVDRRFFHECRQSISASR